MKLTGRDELSSSCHMYVVGNLLLSAVWPGLVQHLLRSTCHDHYFACLQISAANYEARKFGICAGMSIGEAKRLCPNLLVVPYMFDKYERISEQVGPRPAGLRHWEML
jgi:hypothetical protein